MFAAPLTGGGEGGQGLPTQRQWNAVLRLFGAMIAMTGVAVAIAVMVMANKDEEANRFPWEGVLLFSVGLIMVLFSLYYTDPEGGGRRASCVVRRESDMMIDQPPAYWEVCDLSDPPPDYIEPTSVTSGNGEIVVTITRVKSTQPRAAAVNRDAAAAVNIEQGDEPYQQQSDEEPDEPLPSYEEVVTLEENERRDRTSSA